MQLRRVIGVPGATGVGVAAMLGAGVFGVWAPAAAHAGEALLWALGLAFAVAALNATSTTRLARAYPDSGGVYAFGRAAGAPRLGFAAGALFLIGKLASVAAIARIAGEYLVPAAPGLAAVVLLLALAAVNASGVRSTVAVSGVLAVMVVVALVTIDVAGVAGAGAPPPGAEFSAAGVLPAATVLFYAFAGYARVATLGGEVREPRRTLPIAVGVSLTLVGAVAALTAWALLHALGSVGTAASTAPVAELAATAGLGWLAAVGVVVACAGSALGVLAGLSRTAHAMAASGDLPRLFAHLHPRTATPVRAELAVAVMAAVACLLLPSAWLIGASAGAVLGYYAISHTLAWRLGGVTGRVIAVVGGLACLGLAVWAPPLALAIAAAVLVVGFGIRALVRRRSRAS